MNFQHSEEQRLLRDSVRLALGDGVSGLADFGAFGLLVPEALGGSGLGLVEAAIVLEEVGRNGLHDPVAETMLVAGGVATLYPDQAEAMMRGDIPVVSAVPSALARVGSRLKGSLAVAAPERTRRVAASIGNTGLALVAMTDLRERTPRAAIGTREVAFSATVDIGATDAWILDLPDYESQLAVLRCAELLGAAEHCFGLATTYLKDRTQFGQPIGANQALKHLAADVYVTVENIRVSVEYAAAAMDAAQAAPAHAATEDAGTAILAMLAYVPRASRDVAEAAVQFHGGIGLTWEYALNYYVRRIVRLGTALGPVSLHRSRLLERVCPPSKVAAEVRVA